MKVNRKTPKHRFFEIAPFFLKGFNNPAEGVFFLFRSGSHGGSRSLQQVLQTLDGMIIIDCTHRSLIYFLVEMKNFNMFNACLR